MNWKQIGRFLRTAFLLRVPLITLALLAAIGPIALLADNELLGNLFDLRVLDYSGITPTLSEGWTAWYLYSVSFAAFLACFTAVAVINLILYYGQERFDDRALDLGQKRPLLTFIVGLLSALPLVVCSVVRSQGDSDSSPSAAVIWGMPSLGFLSALGLVFVAKVIQLWFTDPKTTSHPPPYLIFPVYRIHNLEKFFDVLYCRNDRGVTCTKRLVNRISQWPLEILRCAGQGYLIKCDDPRGKLALQSGHVFALALSCMAFATYLIDGYAKSKIDANPAYVSALAFVMLFGIVLCWALGALTFFLDRYRVPLISTLALSGLFTWSVPQSDHIYRVEKRDSSVVSVRVSPAELVNRRTENGAKRIILVATAGGGIQAAAWTARVLQSLEEECTPQSAERICDFRNSVVLISGVSGGSLGAITYARSFTQFPTPIDPAAVPLNAARPALDEVAWGWLNPDVWNSILPWFRTQYIDRGWALEEKWAAINQTYIPHVRGFRRLKSDFGDETWLSDWARETHYNSMPALLLNATMVERGQPIVFSSTDFPGDNDPRGLVDFYRLYPGFDIRVTTAARLSASFPYVAPAARANAKPVTAGANHIVDGGYYDNYGITALLGWLQNALADERINAGAVKDVLILQIRPFAEAAQTPPKEVGWGFQLGAPAQALLDVRDTGQSAHDRTELSLFTGAYKSKLKVWRADFFYPDEEAWRDYIRKQRAAQQSATSSDEETEKIVEASKAENCSQPPLSWKLSIEQTQCISEAWKLVEQTDASHPLGPIGCVKSYLQTPPGSDLAHFCKAGDTP